jgi:hypothetical protein
MIRDLAVIDPKNPVCSFFIEYYGLKDLKGPIRLARWTPSPGLLLQDNSRVEQLDELSYLYIK